MNKSRPNTCHESASPRGASAPLAVLLALLAAVTAMAAQTTTSHAAEISNHLRKAFEYLKAKDPDSAVKEFDAVLTLDPKNAEAYANLGVVAFFRRDYVNASQYLHKAVVIDPSLVKSQALLGICQRRLGDPSARVLLEKSFSNLKDKSLRLQVGLELASLYDQQGETGAMASIMRSLVDLDPDNVDVLFTAQRVYTELADDTLNKLAILAPGSARMQQVIAERLVNGGDLPHAIEHYEKALQIDPRLPGVHFELGEAILQSSPLEPAIQAEAEKEFEAAEAIDGDAAKAECGLGAIASSQSDLDRAFAHYQRAYKLNPNEAGAQLGLARLLMMQQKPHEAIKYLQATIQGDPLNSEAHYRLASAYKRLQMNDQAQKEMHLFQEIKKTKDQVRDLYHQMNIQPKVQDDELPDSHQR
ncbi:MAG TPA: tetratricopeptide repeat protein [Candidatus Polarisedimenticolia bacterium]|nr:tetratricopeptide repeat protein [Candidatus Polarisedimenticolia bacterium]